MLYDVNLGVRDYFTYTEAMLNNSLFSYFLKANGLDVHKNNQNGNESTRDIVCLDFDFGSRSYDDELKRLEGLLKTDITAESKERINTAIERVKQNKSLYSEKKRGEIRDKFYNEGVDITYKIRDKEGNIKSEQTIHYNMLFRTSAKAKLGQVIFINQKLYKKAFDWLTMGLGNKMAKDNAKIVEMSAYSPLTTSTIVGTLHIPVNDILILKDQDSYFKTMANVVKADTYTDKKGNTKKKCVVERKETEVKNTIWDGMGIIESDLLPNWVNGMALLRNHFFKMCGLRGHLQLFFKDWCNENGYDYSTYQVQDMFGNWHYLKDIKVITTDNAVKWRKFIDIMGGTPEAAYSYWCNRVSLDGDIFGIVKTDHPSKLGEYQQLSYQMINTLPCTKDEVKAIAQNSIDYVELLKQDNEEFEKFLRKNANEINHYEMLADLYRHNNEFGNSKWFREEKKKIISNYVHYLRKGKIQVKGDNLTIFGNPYGLLLYTVGEDWTNDPTLLKERGCIQCYTNRFNDGEYLAAFRNPHNSPNNICYLHNKHSEEFTRYFDFSNNIMAVNCIETDIQDRMNGCDFDSDFFLVTNQKEIVECAKRCYENYPTIVNSLRESGITYNNTKSDYAVMDNRFASSKMGIGWASNLAQLAMTYYWTEASKEYPDDEKAKELYDNFVILSVIAQIIIDSCKRLYEIDGEEEIKRISKMPCMTMNKIITDDGGNIKTVKCDYPEFMRYTKEIKYTKDGKELPFAEINETKTKLRNRINEDLDCPMNWLEEWLDKIQGASTSETTPTTDFFIKMNGKANSRQMSKVRVLVEDYDTFAKYLFATEKDEKIVAEKLIQESNVLLEKLRKIKIGNIVTINRLIETSLGLANGIGASKRLLDAYNKPTKRILNFLYKLDKERFLINFKPQ